MKLSILGSEKVWRLGDQRYPVRNHVYPGLIKSAENFAPNVESGNQRHPCLQKRILEGLSEPPKYTYL